MRVNAVCPSWVRGPPATRSLELDPKHEDMVKAIVPLGRMAEPEEVADYVFVFLYSPSRSYIKGTALMIDDGMSVTGQIRLKLFAGRDLKLLAWEDMACSG